MERHQQINLDRVTTIKVRQRGGAYQKKAFAAVPQRDSSVGRFLDGLPHILKGNDWRELQKRIAAASRRKKPIIWMIGAHVIKCGLSPILIDLMRHGIIDTLVMHGAGVVHDLEIAHLGATSEDVTARLQDGTFGMARETAEWFAQGVAAAQENNLGLGEGMGYQLTKSKPRFKQYSLLYNAYRLHIPVTVHVAIGCDIVAQHPNFDGAAVGRASHADFKILCQRVRRLNAGGLALLWGSAVILPEVFLKSLAVARNLGRVENFTTANFDMIQHYRPLQNVVSRPTINSGRGFSFTGHHEFMLPLLAVAIKDRLKL